MYRRFPGETKVCRIDFDASDVRLGEDLNQIQDENERQICYASRSSGSYQSSKTNCTTRENMLALAYAVKQFQFTFVGKSLRFALTMAPWNGYDLLRNGIIKSHGGWKSWQSTILLSHLKK